LEFFFYFFFISSDGKIAKTYSKGMEQRLFK
jgi:hypothetical protein